MHFVFLTYKLLHSRKKAQAKSSTVAAAGRAASLFLLSLAEETTGRERFPSVAQGVKLSCRVRNLPCDQIGITQVDVCFSFDHTILNHQLHRRGQKQERKQNISTRVPDPLSKADVHAPFS